MRSRHCFAVAVEINLVAADGYEDESCCAGVRVEICAERFGVLEVVKAHHRRCLRCGRANAQQKEENRQEAHCF